LLENQVFSYHIKILYNFKEILEFFYENSEFFNFLIDLPLRILAIAFTLK
jgi:hypothetical protein